MERLPAGSRDIQCFYVQLDPPVRYFYGKYWLWYHIPSSLNGGGLTGFMTSRNPDSRYRYMLVLRDKLLIAFLAWRLRQSCTFNPLFIVLEWWKNVPVATSLWSSWRIPGSLILRGMLDWRIKELSHFSVSRIFAPVKGGNLLFGWRGIEIFCM